MVEPFRRLIEKDQLIAHRYDGFWAPMDTLKDRQMLEAYSEAAGRRGPCGRAPTTAGRRRNRSHWTRTATDP